MTADEKDVHERPTWPAPSMDAPDDDAEPPTVRAIPVKKRPEPEQSSPPE